MEELSGLTPDFERDASHHADIRLHSGRHEFLAVRLLFCGSLVVPPSRVVLFRLVSSTSKRSTQVVRFRHCRLGEIGQHEVDHTRPQVISARLKAHGTIHYWKDFSGGRH